MAGNLISFAEDLSILEETVAKQEPFAAVVSCAESHVPVGLVVIVVFGHAGCGAVKSTNSRRRVG
jgi:carbonic anhydrase